MYLPIYLLGNSVQASKPDVVAIDHYLTACYGLLSNKGVACCLHDAGNSIISSSREENLLRNMFAETWFPKKRDFYCKLFTFAGKVSLFLFLRTKEYL